MDARARYLTPSAPDEAVGSAVSAADAAGDTASEARSANGSGRLVHPTIRSVARRIAGTVRTCAGYSTFRRKRVRVWYRAR